MRGITPGLRPRGGLTARRSMAGLIDQSTVSATSFVTTIIVGRQAGEGELGAYALGITVLILMATAQDSAVTVPYTLFRRRGEGPDPAAYAGGSLIHHLALVGSGIIGLGIAAVAIAIGAGPGRALGVVGTLLACLPFVLLKEFARRFSFAHHDLRTAIVVDLTVGVLQLAGLAWLGATGRMTAIGALAALGVANALVGVGWLIVSRRHFTIDRSAGRQVFLRHWRFVRWDLLSRVVGTVQGYGALWIVWWLARDGGTEAVGVFAACLGVVRLSNPVIIGVSNVLTPRIADAKVEGGDREVWHVVTRATVVFGTLIAAPTVLLMVVGGKVVELIYGKAFGGQGLTVAILTVAIFVWWAEVSATNALGALERADVYLLSGIAALIVTLGAGIPLVAAFGLPGAAVALAAGSLLETAAMWTVLARMIGPRAENR